MHADPILPLESEVILDDFVLADMSGDRDTQLVSTTPEVVWFEDVVLQTIIWTRCKNQLLLDQAMEYIFNSMSES